MKRGKLISALSTALAVALFAPAAVAQAAETEGERLFRLGRAAMLDGRFDEACPMLSESQRLEPHVGTLLNLAACDESRGRYGSAWVEYQKALTAARAEGQTDRVQLAEERIAAIEPRVPWLRVSAPGSSRDLMIMLDSGELAKAALGTEMPVDPGAHVVTATRDGQKVFDARVELREGEHRTIAVTEPLPDVPPAPQHGPRPEHVIVEPKEPQPEAPATKPLGRWILEPGLFLGYLHASITHPHLSSESGASLTIEDTRPGSSGQPSNCASSECTVAGLDNGSFLVGLSFFGGYAVSDYVALGLRLLGAPSIANGGFFALGPSVVLRASSSLSIGAFLGFGDASLSGNTNATPPIGFRQTGGSTSVKAEGSLAGGPAFGLDLSLKIADLQRGSLAITAMPVFMAGSVGNAFALPIGIAYRFQ